MPARETRFSIAKADIESYFDKQKSRIFSKADLSSILEENREFWRLSKSMSLSRFTGELISSSRLLEVTLEFPKRKYVRYTWGDASMYEVAQSVSDKSHFSHYSAVLLHGLTEQLPKSIFVRMELPHDSKRSGTIDQSNIGRAFSNKQRISTNFASLGGNRIYFLYGKKTGDLGVETIDSPYGKALRCTNIERTLIDIAVRPSYSGGIAEVLKAYGNAQPRVSINKLVAYLKTLDYSYPYHQAIGFYLDRSGSFTDTQIGLVRDLGIAHDFYLDYNMKDTDYIKEWRLFIPRGF